jgi:23S rRNA (uracil1939-C5)-methyltransferase
MEEPYHYRNKSSFPVDIKGQLGFYMKRSHDVVSTKNCLIHGKQINAVIAEIQDWIKENNIQPYDEKHHKGILKHVVIRESKATDKLMVIFVVNAKKQVQQLDALADQLIQKFPNIISVYQNLNKHKGNRILGYESILINGEEHLIDNIGAHSFKISPTSFFQVNNIQANVLYQKAIEYADLQGDEIVFDLYSGIGTISLLLAEKAKKVYGIEVIGAAIDNANENKERNAVDNAEFILGYAEEETDNLIGRGIHPDVVVVDPPRKGLETYLIDKIIDVKPQKIVYVSCKPSTMARDVAIFTQHGYSLEKVQPVDMFPHTMHVEAIILMTRSGSSDKK